MELLYLNQLISIEFGEISLDQINQITNAKEKVVITDIETKFLFRLVLYPLKKKILKSKTKSILNDNSNNTLSADSFLYNLNDNILN